jgi:hypothetical protein
MMGRRKSLTDSLAIVAVCVLIALLLLFFYFAIAFKYFD